MKNEVKFISNNSIWLETELTKTEARQLADLLIKYKKYNNFVDLLLAYSETLSSKTLVFSLEEIFIFNKGEENGRV